MKNLKRLVLVLFVTAAFLFAGVSDLFARRGGGSRSFSRPSRSPSRSAPKSASKSKSSTGTKPKTSTRTTAAPKRTPAQQKSYETAKKNGTAFKSKAEATAAFKSKYASKYTSKYAKQPATRPSHIPQTTMVNGSSVNINYNAGMGGYGCTNSLGAFILYDAMSDAVMMNTLMRNNHYHYDTAPIGTTRVVHRSDSGRIFILVILALVVIASTVFAGVIIVKKTS